MEKRGTELPRTAKHPPILIETMTGFKGGLLNRLKRHEEALFASQCALDIEPGRVEAHIEKGRALLALGRNEEALKAAKAGLAFAGDSAALQNLAARATTEIESFKLDGGHHKSSSSSSP